MKIETMGERDEFGRAYYNCVQLDANDRGSDDPSNDDYKPSSKETANLVSSEALAGNHCPVVDFDFPCRLIPSSTPGHFHLYIDRSIPWDAYCRILDAFVDAGLVQRFWVARSKEMGMTFVRPEWVKKPEAAKALETAIRAARLELEARSKSR